MTRDYDIGEPAARPKGRPVWYTVIVLLVAGLVWLGGRFGSIDPGRGDTPVPAPTLESTGGDAGADQIAAAFAARQSDLIIEGEGTVVHVLRDDNEGSRHQRLLVDVTTGDGETITIKIAHNIDLADRVEVSEGDRIRYKGEYEWNDKGGVIHWTHHDPRGKHEDGWLEANGERVG